MKVLMVAEGIERLGGAEEYLSGVCRGLMEMGHDLRVLYGTKPLGADLITEGFGNKAFLVENFEEPLFLREVGDFNPDVINFQNVIDHNLLARSIKEKPTTVFIHNHESCCPGNSKYWFESQKVCTIAASFRCAYFSYRERCMTRRPTKIIERITARRRDIQVLRQVKKVMCNSRYVAENLIQNGLDRNSVSVNYLFSKFQEGATSWSEKNDVPLVLFVGRLFKEKGVDHLLRALGEIKLPYRAIVVGDGWEKEALADLAEELGIRSQVEFMGFCKSDELAKLYERCRLVVVPSLWPEPFGLVGIEALSFGLPVVAYDVGGIREWLENERSGFLLEPRRIDFLSERITELIRDPEQAEKLGRVGKEDVAKRFSLKNHLENLIEVYHQVRL